MPTIDINSIIKLCTYFSISLACFAFVMWQSVQCIEKYIEKPQGTKLSLKHTSQINQFPAITICLYSSNNKFDKNHLKKCGLSLDDYRINGKWVGNKTLDENCTNPEALFESIVRKKEDILTYIRYRYFDGSNETKEYTTTSSASSKIRSHVDSDLYGRCLTFSPTENMIKSGIRQVELKIKKTSWIFFHTNGMIETKTHTDSEITQIFASSYNKTYLDFDFTVYDMFDFGGQPCETKPKFNHDTCTESKLERKSLEMFGCTTPFGSSKDNICQDYENGSKVMDLYRETMKKNFDTCYNPCLFTSTKATITRVRDGNGYVYIKFKENIKVIEAYHLYSALSMIAEVGGYVGLFLGISVNQVSALFNVLLDKFNLICNRRN